MGTVANKDDAENGREPSESSGLSDIMEIAASLGIEEREGEGITRADDDEADDDLHNLAAGYGGTAAAALVADATVEPPAPMKAANAPKSDPKIPVAAPEASKPPPPHASSPPTPTSPSPAASVPPNPSPKTAASSPPAPSSTRKAT